MNTSTMNTSALIAAGSLADLLARGEYGQLAEVFMGVKLILLCDRSSSMDTPDAGLRGNELRYKVEDRVVADIQAAHRGKVLLVAFGSKVQPCVTGILPEPDGSTHMLAALHLVSSFMADDMHAILISDGEPTDGRGSDNSDIIEYAVKHYTDRLDTAYTGAPGGYGEPFMRRLAEAVHGQHSVNILSDVRQLGAMVTLLLNPPSPKGAPDVQH